ncbi:MAG: glycosyltransferase [Verrucomicrobia bacterium]|nr:glycosyltransferase [Verrucomicrobiota bacterium]
MFTVLHYTGYRTERGGVVAVLRALRETGRFRMLHGVVPEFATPAPVTLEPWRGPSIEGERIGWREAWRARAVARAVQAWLQAAPDRVFHGHSRAGLLVALWLHRWGESRVVVCVHCYGRQRWFYRWAARRLGSRLYWLTPAMRVHYGVPGAGWDQCLPGGVAESAFLGSPPPPAPNRLRLGGAGMLVRWKRWELVLDALAALPPEVRAQVTFEHVGAANEDADSVNYAAELCDRTARLGLMDQVTWRGQEPSSRRLLAAVDLVVVCSDHEPYSMVLQEAWAGGVPALAADSGGPVDLVRPGANGWLFRSGDASSLAAAIAERARTGDWTRLDRAAVRRTARRAAKAALHWEEIYQRL